MALPNRLYIGVLVVITLLILGYLGLKETPQRQLQQKSESLLSSDQESKTTKDCDGKPTPSLTEGPYYKTGSPERTNLLDETSVGTTLTVTGYVFDVNCQPIADAWLDFWQADGNGNYDNVGYKLRGHQYTDASGKYTLGTVVPGRYPGRTPHIHAKVQASRTSPILTSQLFLPQEPQNQQDAIFNQALVMAVQDTPKGKSATFNFVIR
ncbi:MAG: hypothetical protein AAB639_02390 [Patescibacteria group bacterium]